MQNVHQKNYENIVRYPLVRVIGVWLILIGFTIVLATIVGGRFLLNPFVFMIGYGLSLYLTELNPSLKRRYTLKGELSATQIKMAKYGDISLFPLMFIIGGSFIPSGDWRMVWLGTLLATGIHFLLFIPVHGKIMLYLTFLCTIPPIVGMLFKDIPFITFGIVDGVIKISIGLFLFLGYDTYLKSSTKADDK